MENLRAFMLVNALHGTEMEFEFYPEDMESNGSTSESIIDHGFFVGLHSQEDVNKAIAVVEEQGSIQTYEVIHVQEKKPEAEAPKAAEEAPKAAPVQAEPAKGNPAVKEVAGAQPQQHAKQSLISVNLSKLDALQAIVGEIVITESMVASSPELQGLKIGRAHV